MTTVSIFFIILVAVFAVVVFFTEPSKTDKLIRSRLVSLDRKIVSNVQDEDGIVKEVTFSTMPVLDRFLRQNRLAHRLGLLIDQADLHWTVGRLLFASLFFVSLGALLGNWWISPGLLGWAPGLGLGLLPFMFLLIKRNLRFRQLTRILPPAIDLMSRCLRAGQALPTALEVVAQEIDEPLRSEFRRAADEQNFGLPFREAMINLGRRVPLPDFQFLITAILVQKQTGGNLTEVLDKTSSIIRERLRVAGEVKIHTAQGRLTGLILCVFPFAMFFMMNVLSPGYTRVLFESETGQKMVWGALGLMAIGIFLIRKIVNFKI